MPVNKKALVRYQIYDRCLRNRARRYHWQDLVREVNAVLEEEGLRGIGKTQFYQDMNDLQYSTWRAPVEKYKDGRTVYYRYADPHYSINNQPLNETEVEQLKSAMGVLSRFKGMPQFEWINEIIPVVESKMGLVGQKKQVLSFDHNLDYSGLVHVTPLFNAIIHEKVLKVSYQDFKSDTEHSFVFHPYHLRQYNNRWFAFGRNQAQDVPTWNLALDRILAIEDTKETYQADQTDWEEYFYDIVGVTRWEDQPPEEVKLLFTPAQAPYVRSKPLHPTQRQRETERGLEVSITVVLNYELEARLLSYGETVQVLSPTELRESMKNHLSRGAKLYKEQ